MGQNEDLAYAVPKEGSNLWFDNIVITTNCKETEAAHAFINYLLRPESAQANAEFICYSTPNVAALDLIDEELATDPVFWPGDEVLDRCTVYLDLGENEKLYSEYWMQIRY